MNTITITYLPMNVTVSASRGDTLMDAALNNGLELPHSCGGNCFCHSCLVDVLLGDEMLSPMEPPERERLATAKNRTTRSRLACQALVMDGPLSVLIVGDDADWLAEPLEDPSRCDHCGRST